MYHARVMVASKVRKNDLPVKNGDTVSIIRTTSCPKGKWLARDANNRCELMSDVLFCEIRGGFKAPPQLVFTVHIGTPVGFGVSVHCSGLAVCRWVYFSHERGAKHQGDAGTWQEGPSGWTGRNPGGRYYQYWKQVAKMLTQLANSSIPVHHHHELITICFVLQIIQPPSSDKQL